MFGEGFKHMDSSEKLAEGYYTAKIIKAEMKKGNFGDFIQVEVEVKDHPRCNPRIFLINDSPKEGYASLSYEDAMDLWCKNTTAFFNSFEIKEGDFEPSHWVGKVGDITVRVQKKNPQYNEIVPYKTAIKKNEKTPPKKEEIEEDTNFEIF